MMRIKYMIVLALGLLAGICCSSLFKGGCHKEAPNMTNIKAIPAAAMIQQQAKANAPLQQRAGVLQSNQLQLKLAEHATQQSLQRSQIRHAVLKTQLQEMLDEDTVLKKDAPCQSLALKVSNLLQQAEEQDSLYTSLQTNLQAQLQNRDSLLQVAAEQYQVLKASFKDCITQQQSLFAQNKAYHKQERRHQIKHKLRSAAVLVLSAIAAAYLLQH